MLAYKTLGHKCEAVANQICDTLIRSNNYRFPLEVLRIPFIYANEGVQFGIFFRTSYKFFSLLFSKEIFPFIIEREDISKLANHFILKFKDKIGASEFIEVWKHLIDPGTDKLNIKRISFFYYTKHSRIEFAFLFQGEYGFVILRDEETQGQTISWRDRKYFINTFLEILPLENSYAFVPTGLTFINLKHFKTQHMVPEHLLKATHRQFTPDFQLTDLASKKEHKLWNYYYLLNSETWKQSILYTQKNHTRYIFESYMIKPETVLTTKTKINPIELNIKTLLEENNPNELSQENIQEFIDKLFSKDITPEKLDELYELIEFNFSIFASNKIKEYFTTKNKVRKNDEKITDIQWPVNVNNFESTGTKFPSLFSVKNITNNITVEKKVFREAGLVTIKSFPKLSYSGEELFKRTINTKVEQLVTQIFNPFEKPIRDTIKNKLIKTFNKCFGKNSLTFSENIDDTLDSILKPFKKKDVLKPRLKIRLEVIFNTTKNNTIENFKEKIKQKVETTYNETFQQEEVNFFITSTILEFNKKQISPGINLESYLYQKGVINFLKYSGNIKFNLSLRDTEYFVDKPVASDVLYFESETRKILVYAYEENCTFVELNFI